MTVPNMSASNSSSSSAAQSIGDFLGGGRNYNFQGSNVGSGTSSGLARQALAMFAGSGGTGTGMPTWAKVGGALLATGALLVVGYKVIKG